METINTKQENTNMERILVNTYSRFQFKPMTDDDRQRHLKANQHQISEGRTYNRSSKNYHIVDNKFFTSLDSSRSL